MTVFLDIDGVLAIGGIIQEYPLSLLHSLLKTTGASLVVSSDWRLFYSKEELSHFLKWDVIDTTKLTRKKNRSAEIKEYCSVFNIKKYVIFDDVDYFTPDQHRHFVHIQERPLNISHIQKAQEILYNVAD